MHTTFWLAVRTRTEPTSASNSPLALLVTPCLGESLRRDLLQATFDPRSTAQNYLASGQANLFFVRRIIDEAPPGWQVNVHLVTRGDDLWRPDFAFLWIEEEASGRIRPLAFDPYLGREGVVLSADPGEGDVALRLDTTRLVPAEGMAGDFTHLLMVMETADRRYAGTNSPVRLTVEGEDGVHFDYRIPDTPQWEQERAQANVYYVPASGFGLEDIQRVRLSILGDDAWLPQRFFLFGELGSEDHRALVPLVYVPDWGSLRLPWLSTDRAEGRSYVDLPLVHEAVPA